MKDMAYITLVAYEKQRPHFWVRFSKSENGKLTVISHRRFYWHDYEGGQEEALFWAKDWRNWEYRDLRSRGLIKSRADWRKGIPSCYTEPRANNTTGRVGVQRHNYKRTRKHVRRDGSVTYYENHSLWYSAIWIEYVEENGIVRRRYTQRVFSIKKFGEEGAKRLASEARAQAEKYLLSPRHLELRRRYRQQRSS